MGWAARLGWVSPAEWIAPLAVPLARESPLGLVARMAGACLLGARRACLLGWVARIVVASP